MFKLKYSSPIEPQHLLEYEFADLGEAKNYLENLANDFMQNNFEVYQRPDDMYLRIVSKFSRNEFTWEIIETIS